MGSCIPCGPMPYKLAPRGASLANCCRRAAEVSIPLNPDCPYMPGYGFRRADGGCPGVKPITDGGPLIIFKKLLLPGVIAAGFENDDWLKLLPIWGTPPVPAGSKKFM